MAKKPIRRVESDLSERQSTALGQILCDLQSEDALTRAAAVRLLCPCRTAWDVPVQRYLVPLRDDPSPSVRHEVHHVLDEDSNWGKRLEARRMRADLAEEEMNGDEPGPYSMGWRRRSRPLTKGAAARIAWSPRGRR